MNIEEEIIKNKNKVEELGIKVKALIKVLEKEGITSQEEVEEELKSMIERKDES